MTLFLGHVTLVSMVLFILFLYGLAVGSFLNVLIDRLPNEESVLWGHSHCDYCKKRLRWFELIPVFSYIILGGKCQRCQKKLSLQYPIIELLTGILFVWIHSPFIILACAVLVIFVADLKYQIIPDQMLIIILLFLLPNMRSVDHVVAGIAGFLFFWLLWFFTKGKGMGFGDVKLAGLIGLGLGMPLTIVALYIAFLTGAMLGVILLLGRVVGMKSKIAFGPFLLVGAIGAQVWGQQLISLWHAFFI